MNFLFHNSGNNSGSSNGVGSSSYSNNNLAVELFNEIKILIFDNNNDSDFIINRTKSLLHRDNVDNERYANVFRTSNSRLIVDNESNSSINNTHNYLQWDDFVRKTLILKDQNGCTLLMLSCLRNLTTVCLYLLEIQQLSATIPDHLGYLPLHVTAQLGDVGLFNKLMTTNPTALTAKALNGRIPLHFAAQEGHFIIVQQYIIKCPDSVRIIADDGRLPLHLCVVNGNLPSITALITAFPNSVMIPTNDNVLPIHFAINFNHIDVVRLLVHLSPESLLLYDNSGCSAFELALRNSSEELIKLFIAINPMVVNSINTNFSRNMLAYFCLSKLDCNVLKLLLTAMKKCPLLTIPIEVRGNYDRIKQEEFELQKNSLQDDNATASESSYNSSRNTDMALTTVQLGLIAEVARHAEVPDRFGYLPIHMAAQRGDYDIYIKVNDLFPFGNCVTCNNGRTPLHYAAQCGHAAIVQHIMERYPETVLIASIDGLYTAVHLAAYNNHYSDVKIIFNYLDEHQRKTICCSTNIEGWLPLHGFVSGKKLVEMLSRNEIDDSVAIEKDISQIKSVDNRIMIGKCVGSFDAVKFLHMLIANNPKGVWKSDIMNELPYFILRRQFMKWYRNIDTKSPSAYTDSSDKSYLILFIQSLRNFSNRYQIIELFRILLITMKIQQDKDTNYVRLFSMELRELNWLARKDIFVVTEQINKKYSADKDHTIVSDDATESNKIYNSKKNIISNIYNYSEDIWKYVTQFL